MKKVKDKEITQQEADFEELYQAYWNYVYTYEVHHPKDFDPNIRNRKSEVHRNDFREKLEEDGMAIKIIDGF